MLLVDFLVFAQNRVRLVLRHHVVEDSGRARGARILVCIFPLLVQALLSFIVQLLFAWHHSALFEQRVVAVAAALARLAAFELLEHVFSDLTRLLSVELVFRDDACYVRFDVEIAVHQYRSVCVSVNWLSGLELPVDRVYLLKYVVAVALLLQTA